MSAIDIQREILTNALRISCDENDSEGVLKSAQELHQLFPDLLPEQNHSEGKSIDFYKILDLYSSAPKSVVAANYFRAVKKFLRAGNVKRHSREYFALLDAGTILNNRRLRLSHDLVVARDWLLKKNVIPADSSIPFSETSDCFNASPVSDKPLPDLLAVLELTAVINSLEIQALVNQMRRAPRESVEDLLLSAGYVTEKQITWLKTMLYRGLHHASASEWTKQPDWPFGGGPGPGQPPTDFGPFDPSRVPRRPLPTSGDGAIELPLPERPDDNDG